LLVAGWQERLPLWPRSWRAPAPLTRRQQALVLWGMWCLPQIVYFSATNGLFHRYYLSMLAPGVAALVGIGGVALWADYRRPGWRGWLLPAALAGEAALQAYLLAAFPDWSRRLTPPVVGLGLLGAAGLVVARLWPRPGAAALARVAAIAGALAVLIAP